METKDVKEQSKPETKPSKPRCKANTIKQTTDHEAPTKPPEQIKQDFTVSFDN